tara:strand:- start:232 stop:468 length:237 start_codon:yes stop_codon:yes gene_type:complete
MKLHKSMVDELLKTYEVNSGWTEEHKLRTALERLDFSVYVQTNGTQVLVPTKELVRHMKQFERIEQQRKELEAERRGE